MSICHGSSVRHSERPRTSDGLSSRSRGRTWAQRSEVFRTGQGARLTRRSIGNRILAPCLRENGLRHIRFHDLRHTFASLLLANGESLVYVKDQLGHHSTQITVDTYGHLIPGANKAAVDKLDTVTIFNPPATEAKKRPRLNAATL